MRQLIAIALFCAGLFCIAQAQVPMTGAGLGAPSSGGGAFQGSGDILSGAIAYWSCARAYTAAYATGAGKACDAKRTSDSATCTTKFATSGFLDQSTAYCNSNTQTIVQFCNATTCNVTKAYDQSGANDCSSGACDASNAGGGAGPVLNLSGLGSRVCMTFSGGSTSVLLTASGITIRAQPLSGSGVGQVTGATSTNYDLAAIADGSAQNFLTTTLFSLYAGSAVVSAGTVDSSYHAINSVLNGSSSIIVIDGSATGSLSPGTNGILGGEQWAVGGGNNPYVGNFCEARFDAIAYNATQYGNLNSNQHGSSGYSF